MTKKRGDIIESGATPTHADGQVGNPEWLPQRLEWFMNLRFGLFVHWAPYAQWDCIESWPLVPADEWARPDGLRCWEERGKDLERFTRDYFALNRTFNPTDFDPEAWADVAERAGMRYIAFTTKHHDGFCMFDTDTTDYRITHPDCPFHANPRADIVRHVFDAFRKRDMAISCYFSKSDWHSPYYWTPDYPIVDRHANYDTRQKPERWEKFVRFAHAQVEELMTGYGRIDTLWLDGGQVRPPRHDLRMDDMVAMARAHQPGLLVADRTVGGRHENFVTPEQKIPPEPLRVAWESCLTLGDSWKYVPDDTYKPAREVIHMLIETCAKGGNLLLGIGPDARGVLPAQAVERLEEVGRWLSAHGEAIYGTRPIAPYSAGRVRFTHSAPYTYAIVLAPEEGEAAPDEIEIEGARPAAGSDVRWLDAQAPTPWRPTDKGFRLAAPRGLIAADHARVLRFASE